MIRARTALSRLCRASVPMRMASSAAPLEGDLLTLNSDQQALVGLTEGICKDVIGPLVQKMDKQHKFEQSVIDVLFKQGLMGIEIPAEYGGSGMSFTDSILVIETLARTDASVSVMCDVQ